MPAWFETIRHLSMENASDKQNDSVDKVVINPATSWKQFTFKVRIVLFKDTNACD